MRNGIAKGIGLSVVAALVLLALVWQSAEAGIIVTKDGEVFVGRIDAKKGVKEDFVVMTRIEAKDIGKGRMNFERHRIRWFDTEARTLTPEYWKLHRDKKLQGKWQALRPKVFTGTNTGLISELKNLGKKRTKMSLRKHVVTSLGCRFRIPNDWERIERDGVCQLIARNAKGGFNPRILIKAIERPKLSSDRQIDWFKEEIRKLDDEKKLRIRRALKSRLRGATDKDVSIITEVKRGKKQYVVTRFVFFRETQVYFLSMYLLKKQLRDWDELFKKFLKAFSVDE